jgi:hypothetical protein
VLNWTKKQGISQFRDREFYLQEKWVLIADESIQFGNKKLLLVIAVPERRCNQVGALSYEDLTPVVLKVSPSWKSEDIVAEINQHIDLEQVSYCISDTGSNLTKAFRLMSCKHVSDINHKFSLIIQAVFEKNQNLEDYTKALKLLRSQKSMSKIARIVPPNQRIMNRFMNLKPLFEWGMKMIQLLHNNQLTEEEKAALSFIDPLKEFIFDTYQLLVRLEKIQAMLKNNGFSKKYMNMAKRLFSGMNSANALKIKKQVNSYFNELTSKSEGKTICCSSDIIESCFGRYKEIVRGNKSVGISDLCLCIAAMMGNNDPDRINQAMETVSMRKAKEWKKNNICKTLFAEKVEMNKLIERNYITIS